MHAVLVMAAMAIVAPAPEALALGREIAGHGILQTVGPLQTAAEIDSMIAEHSELTQTEQARLRAIGEAQAYAIGARALDSEAQALAANLSIEDLRAIAVFERSEAAEHRRQATPSVIRATMEALGDVDYAGSVRAAFCAETGKLCAE